MYVPGNYSHHAIALKRRSTANHLIEHAAKRVDIRALISLLSRRLLRAHIVWGTDNFTSAGKPGFPISQEFGNAKIQNFGAVILWCFSLHNHIARLQVAMHNSFFVRMCHPSCYLCG